jgi:hypothetical protein
VDKRRCGERKDAEPVRGWVRRGAGAVYGDKRNTVRPGRSGSGEPEFKHREPGRGRLFGEGHSGERAEYNE